MSKIEINNVYKIFGSNPKSILPMVKDGASKEEILDKTGHTVGLDNVTLKIEEGEIFVCMGLSGSGKSTLIRHLNRLIDPTDGEIIVEGTNVMSLNKQQLIEFRRHKMSMVFQRFGLFPHRTVIDNVGYGLEMQGVAEAERKKTAMEKIEAVGLSGFENQFPAQLSGGMQQRVGLARAMAVEPEILIFDEPFSALDPLIRREMQDELLDIQKKLQRTMVFITHDFLEAIKMGDHIAIMKDGEISQVGTPEEIVANPVDKYVKDFCEDVPKYKVLSAGKVMRKECSDESKKLFSDKTKCIDENAKIETLIDQICEDDTAYPIINAQSGELVGEIDRTIVMKSMKSK